MVNEHTPRSTHRLRGGLRRDRGGIRTVPGLYRELPPHELDSSGPDGSGLEIHDVYYWGIQVMKRGHVPMLNVDYDPGGCGCFRDWLHSEREYRTDNQVTTGYFEPPFPAETVCDHATSLLKPMRMSGTP